MARGADCGADAEPATIISGQGGGGRKQTYLYLCRSLQDNVRPSYNLDKCTLPDHWTYMTITSGQTNTGTGEETGQDKVFFFFLACLYIVKTVKPPIMAV